jgi:hypothetical protein
MTTQSQDIIERLERASGPDREIDLTIHLAVCPDGDIAQLMQYRRGLDGKEGMAWDIYYNGCIVFEKYNDSGQCIYNGGVPLPHYTDSIDAALTLVPANHDWSLHADNGEAIAGCMPSSEDGCDIADCPGATPAIALCIAALKARASISSKEQVVE